jgi:prevent-host-death family protein
MIVAAGDFKARCLSLMERVSHTHEEIVISKRGKPVAKLVPVDAQPQLSAFGHLAGSVLDEQDIVSPTGEVWDAER